MGTPGYRCRRADRKFTDDDEDGAERSVDEDRPARAEALRPKKSHWPGGQAVVDGRGPESGTGVTGVGAPIRPKILQRVADAEEVGLVEVLAEDLHSDGRPAFDCPHGTETPQMPARLAVTV